MKKLLLSFPTALLCATATADGTDWLNIATKKGAVLSSIQFKDNGRLTFGESQMTYSDSDGETAIPYPGVNSLLFFSAEDASGIETVTPDAEEAITLTYSRLSQRIEISGVEAASQIRLFSPQGSLLRTARGANSISVAGLPQTMVIATALCGGRSVSKKIIIR